MKKIGLVLAGGGGKGSYQIGVWKALKEFEVDKSISAIAATSIGVLNSILILEDDLQKAEQIWKDISPSQILTLHKSVDIMKNLVSLIKSISPLSEEKISDSLKLGLFSREGLLNILHNNIDLSIVNKSTIPCYATCFNTSNNKAEYFLMNNYSTEEIHSILLATSAIPRLFQAVKIGSDLYYDGFLADNLPVKPLYDSGCDLIFVVHLGRTDVIDHSEFPGTKSWR